MENPLKHIDRTGAFDLPLDPPVVLAYLSPEGERAWVPGWQPTYLHPQHPDTAAGTVFRTHHNALDTIWIILEYDLSAGSARYARLTEGSHIGTVAVNCRAVADRQTLVTVTYSLTATSAAGTRMLEAMTDRAYEAMLQEWRRLILEAHQTSAGAAAR